mmetsp:Transcript_45408/g.108359  ORF Transcript_45408/g.108359 Transcript_45408/m.108359 type:complete len:559 (+) Transcript_45408:67-1743(+)
MRFQGVLVLLFAAVAANAVPTAQKSWTSLLALPQYSAPYSAPAPVVSPHASALKSKALQTLSLSLGRDHSEIGSIEALVTSILNELTAQDTADAALVVTKQGDVTTTIAQSTTANATHDASVVALATASGALQGKKDALATAQTQAINNEALCDTELDYVTTMQSALSSLHGVGADSALIQLSKRLEVSNLIGRAYADQSATVQSGISALKLKIEAKKSTYEAAVTAKQETLNAEQLVWDQASGIEVRDAMRRFAAMISMTTARADLAAAIVLTATSHASVEEVRAVLATLTAKLAELKAEPDATTAIAMGTKMGAVGGVSDLAKAIDEIITSIVNKLDVEQLAETTAKNAKYTARTSLLGAKIAPAEAATVASATLSNVGSQVSSVKATRDAALAAKLEEQTAQTIEKNLVAELRSLMAAIMSSSDTTTSIGLGANKMQANLITALGLGVERSHADFVDAFETLIKTMENNMLTAMNKVLATLALAETELANVEGEFVAKTASSSEATVASQAAISAYEVAQQEFDTAGANLDANNLLRQREKAHLAQLRTIIANLF